MNKILLADDHLMPTLAHTHLATTHSTNSQLIDWVKQSFYQQNVDVDYRQPHRLTADTQTGGRGQHGRQWQSPIGNVYLSLYVPTAKFSHHKAYQLTQRLDGRLSLCVGYQLSQLAEIIELNKQLNRQNLPKLGVKWVNDIGFYQATVFQKLAGILIEPVTVDNQLLGVVIGVGMNIAFTPDLSGSPLSYQAVSLQDLIRQDLTGKKLVAQDFYQPISQAIWQAIEQFNGFDNVANVQQFIQDFAQVDVLTGKMVQVTLPTDDRLIGQAVGIDNNGSLQIRQNDGTITPVWTGTIQVLG